MASYIFRYLNNSGSMIRLVLVQCASDDDALARRDEIMAQPYAALEISRGDDVIFTSDPHSSAANVAAE